jgi:hypothetical protein
MKNSIFQTPISLHVFNRPETTKKLFDVIRIIKPEKIFITADGPRDGYPNDIKNCKKVRDIFNEIDWDCDLQKNFSEINKGAFRSTSEGITWVFTHVDRAIILEDDCIPGNSFFTYCNELLNYYENDKRIALISGNNFQLNKNQTDDSYYFSRYTHIWGWATWKRTWEQVDFSMKDWPEYKKINGLKSLFSNKKAINYWSDFFQDMYDKKSEPHWDLLLSLSSYMNNTLTIIPNKNLVSNIGFGPSANITKKETKFHSLKTEAMSFPLQHPKFVSSFINADNFTEKTRFSGTSSFLKNKARKYMPVHIWNFLKNLRDFFVKD